MTAYVEVFVSEILVRIDRSRGLEYEYYNPTAHFCLCTLKNHVCVVRGFLVLRRSQAKMSNVVVTSMCRKLRSFILYQNKYNSI